MQKTILIVAMPDSVHTVRWLAQLNGQGWRVHLFPSRGGEVIHPDMTHVTVHHWFYSERLPSVPKSPIGIKSWLSLWLDRFRNHVFDKWFPTQRSRQMDRVIHRLQPDIVHSMEIQAAGYLTLATKKRFSGRFPQWLVTNWGSDIFLFGRLQAHKAKIREVLESCDSYSCECERDVGLARQFGFAGQVMPVFPNTGGFDLTALLSERNRIPASDRKVILLKGYQHWAGRALVGLRALARCRDVLDGYSVCIYSASPDVVIAGELLADEAGIPVRFVEKNTPHNEMLLLHSQARISIGLSISDAISTSFIEAIVMGSFPIQSCTACANEWIEHGVSGMIVPPEDPDVIEMAIRTALLDDALVNSAAEMNWKTALARLDGDLLKQKAIDMYTRLL